MVLRSESLSWPQQNKGRGQACEPPSLGRDGPSRPVLEGWGAGTLFSSGSRLWGLSKCPPGNSDSPPPALPLVTPPNTRARLLSFLPRSALAVPVNSWGLFSKAVGGLPETTTGGSRENPQFPELPVLHSWAGEALILSSSPCSCNLAPHILVLCTAAILSSWVPLQAVWKLSPRGGRLAHWHPPGCAATRQRDKGRAVVGGGSAADKRTGAGLGQGPAGC